MGVRGGRPAAFTFLPPPSHQCDGLGSVVQLLGGGKLSFGLDLRRAGGWCGAAGTPPAIPLLRFLLPHSKPTYQPFKTPLTPSPPRTAVILGVMPAALASVTLAATAALKPRAVAVALALS